MNKPIKQAVNDLYRDVQMSEQELEHLLQLPSQVTRRPWWQGYGRALAASGGVMILCLCLWLTLLTQSPADRTQAIIADVVDNHLSHKTLKYNTDSLSDLSDRFSYLGFMVSSSKPMADMTSTLLGARPCLIVNIPAAQLRYQTDSNSWVTVFQTRYEKTIHGKVPNIQKQSAKVATVSGVKVSVWRDKGLLFAMAEAN